MTRISCAVVRCTTRGRCYVGCVRAFIELWVVSFLTGERKNHAQKDSEGGKIAGLAPNSLRHSRVIRFETFFRR
jgi:hypothetical protein